MLAMKNLVLPQICLPEVNLAYSLTVSQILGKILWQTHLKTPQINITPIMTNFECNIFCIFRHFVTVFINLIHNTTMSYNVKKVRLAEFCFRYIHRIQLELNKCEVFSIKCCKKINVFFFVF